MAESTRKKRGARQAILVDLPDNAASTTAETPDETRPATAAEEQITNALESEAQGAEAMIYRADPSTGKEAFLDRVSAEMVTHDWIGKEYGGGKYRVQFRKPGPNGGAFVYGGQKRFEVDPNIPPKAPRWARTPASGPVSNVDGSPATPGGMSPGMDHVLQSGILTLFTQMQNANQMVLAFVEKMASANATPAKDGPSMIEIITALTPLLTPLLNLVINPREQKDPIELATKLLELRGDKNTGAPTDVMKTVRDVFELREMFGGAAGEPGAPDPMLKLIETLAPQLIDAFKQAQAIDAQRAASATATIGRPATPPALGISPAKPEHGAGRPTGELGPASQPSTTETASGEMMLLYVAQRIPKILKLAELGKNPELYAQLEEDVMPEQFKSAARVMAAREDFIDLIFAQYPALLAHRPWMEEFFDVFAAALLGELDEVDDEDDLAHDDAPLSGEAKPRDEVGNDRANVEADTSTQPGNRNGTVE